MRFDFSAEGVPSPMVLSLVNIVSFNKHRGSHQTWYFYFQKMRNYEHWENF
jgi:hypothetical protein